MESTVIKNIYTFGFKKNFQKLHIYHIEEGLLLWSESNV